MDNKETQSQELANNNEVAGNASVVNDAASNNFNVSGGNNKPSKGNPFWMIASIVLAIALVLVIIFPIGGGSKDETIATVNSKNITKDDLFNTISEYYGDSVLLNVLDNMITEEVVGQEAKAKNITLTDADIDADIAAIKLDYGTDENFQSVLAYSGMTEDDLKKTMKIQTLIRLLLQGEVNVTDEQVQAYFDENKATLGGSEEQVRASHILVTDKELAEDILKQLKDGADFAELAAKHGTDGTATQGGDLGFFTYGTMVEPFSKAAFALDVNELSDVVETEFGYHIILKTDYKPATEADFDSVKEAIRVKLVNEDIYTNNSTYTEELRNKAKITNKLQEESDANAPAVEEGALDELPLDDIVEEGTEGETAE